MAPLIFAPDSCGDVLLQALSGTIVEGVSHGEKALVYETYEYDARKKKITSAAHIWCRYSVSHNKEDEPAWLSRSGAELPHPGGSWKPTIEGFKVLSTSLGENFEARKAKSGAITECSLDEPEGWEVVQPTATAESLPCRYTCLAASAEVYMVDLTSNQRIGVPLGPRDYTATVQVFPALLWTPGSSDASWAQTSAGRVTRGAVAVIPFEPGHKSDHERILKHLSDTLRSSERWKEYTQLNASPDEELALPDKNELLDVLQHVTEAEGAST